MSDLSDLSPTASHAGVRSASRSPLPMSFTAARGLKGASERKLEDGPIIIGVCAMKKKVHSKPMKELLQRLISFTAAGIPEFQILIFEEDTILHAPVEEWPLCEALIAFFSTGFPLKKAQSYAALRQPLVFNDLSKQEMLFDRRQVYKTLVAAGVPVPKHTVLEPGRDNAVDEQEDYLEINGCRIQKPLVEKPASGEDHNIYLYYPRAQGGGSKRLFRKIGDRSSQFYPEEHTTRVHDGNAYIYEELLQTEGTDVKVYTVGPEYAHAEARKSPVVDGKVMRNSNGREVRYPVLLTAVEKEIARKVVLSFGQTICGFDLLRSNGASYVCDVNGWSFVKDSEKFWDDSANLIRQLTLEALAPLQLERFPLANAPFMQRAGNSEEDEEASGPADPEKSELMCVVAIVRHGDRTPKQKLKFVTHEPLLLSLLVEFADDVKEDELKLKKVRMMEELTKRIESIVGRLEAARKQGDGHESSDADQADDQLSQLRAVKQVLRSHPFHGIYRKAQLKIAAWETRPDGSRMPTAAQFILKWGGELTDLGQTQAHLLGARFRSLLYPGDKDGVLRLHATYRHDLKIYASDEGRVQMSAAAFTKGFLDLEGMLTPILASLVSKNKSVTAMLDDTPAVGREGMEQAKTVIHRVLTSEKQFEPHSLSSGELPAVLPPAYISEIEERASERTAAPAALAVAPAEEDSPKDGKDSPKDGKKPSRVHPPRVSAATSPLLLALDRGECSMLLKSLKAMGTPKQTLHELRKLVDTLVSELRHRDIFYGERPSRESNASPRVPSVEVGEADAASATAGSSAEAVSPASGGAVSPLPLLDADASPSTEPANGETPHLHHVRWAKLAKDFYKPKKGVFDTTKIPDIYDNVIYDILHNRHLGLVALPELYVAARGLASFVVPQEYGIDPHDKVSIGMSIGGSMLGKLRRDFLACMTTGLHQGERVHTLDHAQLPSSKGVRSPERHVRSRIYFTSESHIHSLFNVLRWGNAVVDGATSIFTDVARAKFDEMELCYLTHIVFRVLHKKSLDPTTKSAYTVQVLVSPGVSHHDAVVGAEEYLPHEDSMSPKSEFSTHAMHCTDAMILSSRDDLTLEEVDRFLLQFVGQHGLLDPGLDCRSDRQGSQSEAAACSDAVPSEAGSVHSASVYGKVGH